MSKVISEQIRKLVANARTEDALNLLAKHHRDGIQLLAQFNGAKRQNNLGVLDNNDWFRMQNKLNQSILELADQIGEQASNDVVIEQTQPRSQELVQVSKPAEIVKKPKVFISYNHGDHADMRIIKYELEKAGIEVTVDIQNMEISGSIQKFINDAIKNNEFILSIVSERSLSSGWVGKETSMVLLLNQLDEKKWIPVDIDKKCFDDEFYTQKLLEFDKKIEESKKRIIEIATAGGDTTPISTDQKRRVELRTNFGTIIDTLRTRLVVDLSSSGIFDSGIQRIVNHIKNNS